MSVKKIIAGIFILSTAAATTLQSHEVHVRLPHQEGVILEVQPEDRVASIKDIVEAISDIPKEDQLVFFEGRFLNDKETLDEINEIWIELPEKYYASEDPKPKKTYVGYRNYHTKLTSQEEKDIRYILKTLAKKSLVQLYRLQSQLESAGDRIDQVHPLRFLSYIFTDDELKAYIQAVKKRGGWVWGEFIGGLKESLREEADLQNMTDSMVNDFCNRIGVGTKLIYNPLRDYRFEEFVKLLIINIPRDDDSGRYDM